MPRAGQPWENTQMGGSTTAPRHMLWFRLALPLLVVTRHGGQSNNLKPIWIPSRLNHSLESCSTAMEEAIEKAIALVEGNF